MSRIQIDTPVSRVFDFVSTPENDFQWQYGTLAAAIIPKRNGAEQTFFRIFSQASAPHFFKIAERLLEKAMRSQLEENLAALNIILEIGDSANDLPGMPPQARNAD